MHQQTNNQIFITVSMMVAKNLLFGQDYVETTICWVLSSFFFDRNVNGQGYLNPLNDKVMTVLFQNKFHENQFQRLPRVIAVRVKINQLFGETVLSLHSNTEWPPRYPGLTPCDFFLWGYLKDKVFRTPPRKSERQRIITE